jgi:hypothetical protein
MQNKRTEPYEHCVHLPALWKFLLSRRRTVGFLLLGAAIAAITAAIRLPMLHTYPQQPKDLSDLALDRSAKAIVIDPATQAITLEAIDSDQQRD